MPFGSGRPRRHYGLLANANRAESIATARALLGIDPPAAKAQKRPDITRSRRVCALPMPALRRPHDCIEVSARGCEPR